MQKILTRLRYPKLFLLCMSALVGFLVYFDQNNFHFHKIITDSGYIGIFLAGFFLAHGFTMGPAIATLLIISQTESLLVASVIATVGTVIGSGVFYNLLRISYHSELAELSRMPFFVKLQQWAKKNTPRFVRIHLFPIFAGIISATPLPDEFSVVLIKESEGVSIITFTVVTGIMGIFGVTIVLLIGKVI